MHLIRSERGSKSVGASLTSPRLAIQRGSRRSKMTCVENIPQLGGLTGQHGLAAAGTSTNSSPRLFSSTAECGIPCKRVTTPGSSSACVRNVIHSPSCWSQHSRSLPLSLLLARSHSSALNDSRRRGNSTRSIVHSVFGSRTCNYADEASGCGTSQTGQTGRTCEHTVRLPTRKRNEGGGWGKTKSEERRAKEE